MKPHSKKHSEYTQLISTLLRKEPLFFRYILKKLNLESPKEKSDFKLVLKNMVESQALYQKLDLYVHPDHIYSGVVSKHEKGFAFCKCENREEDIFLSAQEAETLFTGDIVRVASMSPKNKRREFGVLLLIEQRKTQRMVGRVVLEGKKILVQEESASGVVSFPLFTYDGIKHAQLIEVDLVWSSDCATAHAKKHRLLDHLSFFEQHTHLMITQSQVPVFFPKKCLSLLDDLEKEHHRIINDSARLDLTHLDFFTIDGADAKDFDDAVFCEQLSPDVWHVMVAIADVSAYVKPNDPIDCSAQTRGNSIYLVNQVIPMLPAKLSDDWCSLKPKERRAVMVADIYWNSSTGKMDRFSFKEAIIYSKQRFTYEQVEHFLQTGEQHFGFKERLQALQDLHGKLRAFRQRRGVFDIQSMDLNVQIEPKTQRVDLSVCKNLLAHQVIEECMLLANVCAAEYLLDGLGIYRVHAPPSQEAITRLAAHASSMGIKGLTFTHLEDFQRFINATCEQEKYAKVGQLFVLQAMQRALYSRENSGHFGLNFSHYTHFTSPIRRYPDLLVHRLLKAKMNAKKHAFPVSKKQLDEWAAHCSQTERVANQLSWKQEAFFECVCMDQADTRQPLDAVVVGTHADNVFIQLSEPLVRGTLKIGHHSPKLSIGDCLQVTYSRIDWSRYRILFKT